MNLPKVLAIITSSSIAIATIAILYVLFVPIDVLTDWKYTIDQKEYKAGDTIVIHSRFTKLSNKKGVAARYFVCETTEGNSVRISAPESVADRPARIESTDIYLAIPREIPILPTECFVEVVITYQVLPLRNHIEINKTPKFRVIEADQPELGDNENISADNDNEVIENAPMTTKKPQEAFVAPAPQGFQPEVTHEETQEDRNVILIPEWVEDILGL